MSLSDRLPKNQRDRRALLILGGALLIGAFFRFGVKPYRAALADTRARIVIGRDSLSKELGFLEKAELYPGAYRAAESALVAHSSRLFEQQDPTMATAELGALVSSAAHGNHVYLRESLTQPSTTSPEGVRTLQITVGLEGDFEGLLGFLRQLEGGQRLVRIDGLNVQMGEAGPDLRAGTEALDITATIRGYSLTDSIPKPPPGRGQAPGSSGRSGRGGSL
jgi:hypothetical protein